MLRRNLSLVRLIRMAIHRSLRTVQLLTTAVRGRGVLILLEIQERVVQRWLLLHFLRNHHQVLFLLFLTPPVPVVFLPLRRASHRR